jgi:hypothetical protein
MALGGLWKPSVRENCGWYASAQGLEGYAYVSVSTTGSNATTGGKVIGYNAFINDSGNGYSGGIWCASAKTPKEALSLAREQFEKQLKTMRTVDEVLRRGVR